MTTKPLPLDPMLQDELSNLNKKLYDLYSNAQGLDTFNHNIKELAKKYIDQFGEARYTWSKFSSFRNSFRGLAELIKSDLRR